jgi:hypothetical protein
MLIKTDNMRIFIVMFMLFSSGCFLIKEKKYRDPIPPEVSFIDRMKSGDTLTYYIKWYTWVRRIYGGGERPMKFYAKVCFYDINDTIYLRKTQIRAEDKLPDPIDFVKHLKNKAHLDSVFNWPWDCYPDWRQVSYDSCLLRYPLNDIELRRREYPNDSIEQLKFECEYETQIFLQSEFSVFTFVLVKKEN